MSNINWNQFANNFMNNFNKVAQNNVQNNQQPTTQGQQQTQSQSYIAQPYLPQTAAQLSQSVAELALLNQQQTANMLKDLLQMPKNFEQLLSQIANTPNETLQKTALMLLASSLNTAELSALLQNNSKQAMSNLYQMLANFNQIGMNMNDEQTSQLSKLISFVAASSTSDIQAVRTTMLMYLPWLPLTDPNAFKLEIANGGADGGIASDDFITVLLSTENYGNLKADIYKTEKDGIRIELTTSQTFPQKDIIVLLKEESEKHNININLILDVKEAFNQKKNEKSETQVYMNSSPGLNPFLLLISNTLIKHVHNIDKKENLREQRKEKITNGES